MTQVTGQFTCCVRAQQECFAHEVRDDPVSFCMDLLCFRSVAIEWSGIVERHADAGLVAFRANERVCEIAAQMVPTVKIPEIA